MGHLRATIKTVLDRNESACLDNEDEKSRVLGELEKAIYPMVSMAERLRGNYPRMAEAAQFVEKLKDMPLSYWAQRVHDLAVAKGWWEKQLKKGSKHVDPDLVKDTVPEKLMLIVRELSEALEEGRVNHWDTYWNVDGVHITATELRSLVFRTYDGDEQARATLASLSFHVTLPERLRQDAVTSKVSRDEFLDGLLTAISTKFKAEGVGVELIDSIIRTFDLVEALGYDTEAIMRWKNNYNETRNYRHGNKRF